MIDSTARPNTETVAQTLPTAVISLGTVRENYRSLARLAGPAETSAVVKCDAYGHGAVQVATCLARDGCTTFFVTNLSEGIALRKAVPPPAVIYIFNGLAGVDPSEFLQANLTPVCNSLEDVRTWINSSADTPAYAIHFDTGMNWLGAQPSTVSDIITLCTQAPPSLIMTHLANADMPDDAVNTAQLAAFNAIAASFPSSRRSMASTGGMYLDPRFAQDLVRPGIGIYGGGPARPSGVKLTPALTLTAPVLAVFDIPVGDRVGYGGTFETHRPTRLATVALGYGDGYLRSGSNNGFAVLEGAPCPIVGRVSMDLITLDVTDCADTPVPGMRAEFLGPQAGLEIQAEALGTIGYELTCRLGGRISRSWQD